MAAPRKSTARKSTAGTRKATARPRRTTNKTTDDTTVIGTAMTDAQPGEDLTIAMGKVMEMPPQPVLLSETEVRRVGDMETVITRVFKA